jgi:hypothetical protein
MRRFVIWAAVMGAVWLAAAQEKPEVPKVDGGAGACWVDFTVTAERKPVYNAKIHVLVRYGLVHKVDLEVGTNSEGKARVAGIPQNVKKPPLVFDIRKDLAVTTVSHDPASNCHASYDVALPTTSSK